MAGIASEKPGVWQRMTIVGGDSGAVRYRPAAWLGRPLTPSERAQFCRELERMARERLVARMGWAGTRTSSVRLVRCPAPAAAATATEGA